jgi:hypothetical protein
VQSSLFRNLINLDKSRPNLKETRYQEMDRGIDDLQKKLVSNNFSGLSLFIKFYVYIKSVRASVWVSTTEKRTAVFPFTLFAPIAIPCTASMFRINIQE